MPTARARELELGGAAPLPPSASATDRACCRMLSGRVPAKSPATKPSHTTTYASPTTSAREVTIESATKAAVYSSAPKTDAAAYPNAS